jgi:phosphoribosylformylglycinamidine cyclo-ligase
LDLWRERLLAPTALYVKLMKELMNSVELHAAAHITGGGMSNIPRVLPHGLKMNLRRWSWPAEFMEVQKRTSMSDEEMLETLNCGIGFVLVLESSQVEKAKEKIHQQGFLPIDLGEVIR